MQHLGTRTLQTPRLTLCRHAMDDAGHMYAGWAADPEVTKFLSWPPHESIAVTESVLADWVGRYGKRDFYQWAIVVRGEGDALIGSIGVTGAKDSVGMVEVGYCIARRWWNQGMTSEALLYVIRFLFDQVGVNRIQARHDTRNPNSGRVMQTCGMRREGTLRQAGRNNQGICDEALYAILKSDGGWRAGEVPV